MAQRLISILALIFSFQAQAAELCKAKDSGFDIAYTLISFPPPFQFNDERPANGKYDNGEEWAWTAQSEYAQFTNEQTGSYTALCTGMVWAGWGKPTDACIGYCRSAVNLLAAVAAESDTFKEACKLPPVNENLRRTGGVVAQACVSCGERAHVDAVQKNLKTCMAVFAAEAGKKSPNFDPSKVSR